MSKLNEKKNNKRKTNDIIELSNKMKFYLL